MSVDRTVYAYAVPSTVSVQTSFSAGVPVSVTVVVAPVPLTAASPFVSCVIAKPAWNEPCVSVTTIVVPVTVTV